MPDTVRTPMDLTEWDSMYRLDEAPQPGELLIMLLDEGLCVAPPGWVLFGERYVWRISTGNERFFPFPVITPPASHEFMKAD